MAKSFVAVEYALNRQSESEVEFSMNVSYFDPDVSTDASIQGPHEVRTGPVAVSTSATQLLNRIADVVIAHAATKGLTVGNNDILLNSMSFI